MEREHAGRPRAQETPSLIRRTRRGRRRRRRLGTTGRRKEWQRLRPARGSGSPSIAEGPLGSRWAADRTRTPLGSAPPWPRPGRRPAGRPDGTSASARPRAPSTPRGQGPRTRPAAPAQPTTSAPPLGASTTRRPARAGPQQQASPMIDPRSRSGQPPDPRTALMESVEPAGRSDHDQRTPVSTGVLLLGVATDRCCDQSLVAGDWASAKTTPVLPSWSAITVSDGASLSSTTVPPAARAAAIRCSATSGATYTSTWNRCREVSELVEVPDRGFGTRPVARPGSRRWGTRGPEPRRSRSSGLPTPVRWSRTGPCRGQVR